MSICIFSSEPICERRSEGGGGGGRISISWPIRDVAPFLGSKFKKDPDFWFKFGVNSRLWVLFFRKASFQYHTWGKILIFGDQSLEFLSKTY